MTDQVDLGGTCLQQNAVDVAEQAFAPRLIAVDGWNIDRKDRGTGPLQRVFDIEKVRVAGNLVETEKAVDQYDRVLRRGIHVHVHYLWIG